MKPIKALLLGAGGRGFGYASYTVEHGDKIQFIGVAEPVDVRREKFVTDYNIAPERTFNSWKEALSVEKFADVVFICTQDQDHVAPTEQALALGYHVILEKPMAVTPADCVKLGELAKEKNLLFAICHVMRYNAFGRKVKEVIEQGLIGDIMNVEHKENVWNIHQAHSYVRGNWRRSDEASPMILAKSCHDMDMLLWWIDSKCTSVSSFGSLGHFKPEKAPVGATKRCFDGCAIKDRCPYDCEKVYLEQNHEWMQSAVSIDTSKDALKAALLTGPYGRCVYHCDNDVVDHQVASMAFESGAVAVFTMSAFNKGGREVIMMGTKGMLTAIEHKEEVEVYDFETGATTVYPVTLQAGGHGGGDTGLMDAIVEALATGKPMSTGAEVSVESHLMAFAAEASRLSGKTIDMANYYQSFLGN